MAMQIGLYMPGFAGPDSLPFSPGMRARLVRGAPPHLKGAIVAILGPAQGHDMGEVVLLLGQLHDMPDEGTPRPKTWQVSEEPTPPKSKWRVPTAKYQKGKASPQDKLEVPQWKMWADLLTRGVHKDKIDGLSTFKLYKLWEKERAAKGTPTRVRKTIATGSSAEPPEACRISPATSEEDLITLEWGVSPPQE